MLPNFLQLVVLDPTWTGYMRDKTADCGGHWYSFHKMVRLFETMEYRTDDVSLYQGTISLHSVLTIAKYRCVTLLKTQKPWYRVILLFISIEILKMLFIIREQL